MLSYGDTIEATENLLNMLLKTASNSEFMEQVNMQLTKWQKEGFPYRKPTI
jgi:transcription termination factor Rho